MLQVLTLYSNLHCIALHCTAVPFGFFFRAASFSTRALSEKGETIQLKATVANGFAPCTVL